MSHTGFRKVIYLPALFHRSFAPVSIFKIHEITLFIQHPHLLYHFSADHNPSPRPPINPQSLSRRINPIIEVNLALGRQKSFEGFDESLKLLPFMFGQKTPPTPDKEYYVPYAWKSSIRCLDRSIRIDQPGSDDTHLRIFVHELCH